MKPVWKAGILGLSVRYDPDYVVPRTGVKFTANWQIKCPQHVKCAPKKKHVSKASTSTFGPIQPLAFLHAWALGPTQPGKTHTASEPSDADVAAMATDHREELEEVLRGHGL